MPFTKLMFSGGTNNGKNIAIGSNPTGIHRTNGVTGMMDEVWLWATNVATSSVQLTVTFGKTGITNQVSMSIEPTIGSILVIPGWCLANTAATGALDISASSNISGALNINGFVNRMPFIPYDYVPS